MEMFVLNWLRFGVISVKCPVQNKPNVSKLAQDLFNKILDKERVWDFDNT